jgi:fluoride exporter
MADGSWEAAQEDRAMDDELQASADEQVDAPVAPRDRDEPPDLLDAPVLPIFGLSAATLASIFIGGALGTLCRWVLASHHAAGPGTFPWVTLLVNLSGSFAIGLLVPLTEQVSHRAPWVRPLVMVGFLGGWTTYSTLAVDAALLIENGAASTCLLYLVVTVAGGLALVVAGHAAGRRLEVPR